ncbi:hypothetical protein EYC84_007907 [Monilinia fructicola]|uniref:Uncharacterized protein n=1 Tax=Monilinia fructicola TaxID=38448 RepID=A0A5M9JI06_MONFR|nr:hypothetical protein EYC84_007907 [Monilinia fructicola]
MIILKLSLLLDVGAYTSLVDYDDLLKHLAFAFHLYGGGTKYGVPSSNEDRLLPLHHTLNIRIRHQRNIRLDTISSCGRRQFDRTTIPNASIGLTTTLFLIIKRHFPLQLSVLVSSTDLRRRQRTLLNILDLQYQIDFTSLNHRYSRLIRDQTYSLALNGIDQHYNWVIICFKRTKSKHRIYRSTANTFVPDPENNHGRNGYA